MVCQLLSFGPLEMFLWYHELVFGPLHPQGGMSPFCDVWEEATWGPVQPLPRHSELVLSKEPVFFMFNFLALSFS